MSDIIVITGDDVIIPNTIIKDGSALSIPPSAVVTCRLVSLDQSKSYCAPVIQVSTESEADWSNGLVAVRFPSATTLEILDDKTINWKKGTVFAKLETKIENNGRQTWYETLGISRGSI